MRILYEYGHIVHICNVQYFAFLAYSTFKFILYTRTYPYIIEC